MYMYRLIGGLPGVGRRSGRGRTAFSFKFSFFPFFSSKYNGVVCGDDDGRSGRGGGREGIDTIAAMAVLMREWDSKDRWRE